MKKQLFLVALVCHLCVPAFAIGLSDKVASMSDSGRQKFTGMLLRQSGKICTDVLKTFDQGPGKDENTVVWNVRCTPREDYAIVFYNDDANTTRVMTCADLKSLGSPSCFSKARSK